MDSQPLVTVVTIVFNAAEDLKKTIQSVASQTYPNIEYIVVDGKSTDGTLEVIQENQKYISRWVSEKDKGIYDAMNKAVAMATGEYINFLNAGDWYISASTIEKVIAQALPEADFIYGGHEARHDTFIKKKAALPPEMLWKHMVFSHQSLLVRASYQKKHLFSLGFKVAADFNFIYNAYKDGAVFQNTGITVASYDMGGYSAKWVITAYKENFSIVRQRDKSFRIYAFHLGLIVKQYLVVSLKNIIPKNWFESLMRLKNSI